MFEEKVDFNYKVGNCKNIVIKTSSKSSISTPNKINIVVITVKIFK